MGRFDLHVHTRVFSEDSRLDPDDAVTSFMAQGFAGFALTEHNAVWPLERIGALARDSGLVIVPGVELEVDEMGHVLVLGWDDEPIWRYHRWARLRAAACEKGAVVSVAHPFRPWFPLWALQQAVPVSPERERRLTALWDDVGCVEVENGRSIPEANRRARVLARARRWRVTAGSDAHASGDVGTASLLLPDTVRTAADVVRAIASGAGAS